MKNKSKSVIAIAFAVLLLVGAVVCALYAVNNPVKQDVTTVDSADSVEPSTTNSDNKFASLKGDEFDEAFIADMLAHHEGAVNMAEQAQAVTAHEEIRTMAREIVQAQSLEMIDMREWQQEWGYEVTNSGGHMSHGGKGADMSGDMIEMQNKLKDLTGDAYDKEFLKQMIIHHEQAVEMAKFADTNAKHQEIKDLAKDIITAQESEIGLMKTWQKEWGYVTTQQ